MHPDINIVSSGIVLFDSYRNAEHMYFKKELRDRIKNEEVIFLSPILMLINTVRSIIKYAGDVISN